jgi:hypothetical protein
MGIPQMGVCGDCRQVRFLSPKGACEACVRMARRLAARGHPDALRQHPDLQDFDDYAERWYGSLT